MALGCNVRTKAAIKEQEAIAHSATVVCRTVTLVSVLCRITAGINVASRNSASVDTRHCGLALKSKSV